MIVKDIINQKRAIITTRKEMAIKEAMDLLIKNKISCLPVLDESDRLLGIISDKDIFRIVYDNDGRMDSLTVADGMTENLIVGLIDDELAYIAGVMTENRIRHVPIVEEDHIIGLVSVGDIVKTQMEDMKVQNRYLWQYIEGSYPG